MVIHYRGTRYSGWQRQPDQPTVQGALEQAFEQILSTRLDVIGAGRTDAGVHARGQVAHCQVDRLTDTRRLRRSLNAVLPGDIRVFHLSHAGLSFHARKDALRKRYEYQIYNGPVVSPFVADYVLHVASRLDLEAMQRAGSLLTGRHDFSSFAAAGCTVQNKYREISHSVLKRRGSMLTYRVEANGFLHHMVRNIVGTLVEVGFGKRSAGQIPALLAAGDRTQAGPTAPPQGLCLARVWYSSNAGRNT